MYQPMQRSQSAFMMDNSLTQSSSPQEKLRKISFDASQLALQQTKNIQLQNFNAQGWDVNGWQLRNTKFNFFKNQKKPFNRLQLNRTSPLKQKYNNQSFSPQNKKKYIDKLQEKLIQLIKVQQNFENGTSGQKNNYLQPPKLNYCLQKTNSTSESDRINQDILQKNYQTNGMNFNFKIKKMSKQTTSPNNLIKKAQSELQKLQKNSRSLLVRKSFDNNNKKQFSIISYPIQDRRSPRLTKKKIVRLQDFIHNMQAKQNQSFVQKKPQTNPQEALFTNKQLQKPYRNLIKINSPRKSKINFSILKSKEIY